MYPYVDILSMIQQDLTILAIQAKGLDGKWTRKPLAYREYSNIHIRVTRPPEICVNPVFKHIHAASIDIIKNNKGHNPYPCGNPLKTYFFHLSS